MVLLNAFPLIILYDFCMCMCVYECMCDVCKRVCLGVNSHVHTWKQEEKVELGVLFVLSISALFWDRISH